MVNKSLCKSLLASAGLLLLAQSALAEPSEPKESQAAPVESKEDPRDKKKGESRPPHRKRDRDQEASKSADAPSPATDSQQNAGDAGGRGKKFRQKPDNFGPDDARTVTKESAPDNAAVPRPGSRKEKFRDATSKDLNAVTRSEENAPPQNGQASSGPPPNLPDKRPSKFKDRRRDEPVKSTSEPPTTEPQGSSAATFEKAPSDDGSSKNTLPAEPRKRLGIDRIEKRFDKTGEPPQQVAPNAPEPIGQLPKTQSVDDNRPFEAGRRKRPTRTVIPNDSDKARAVVREELDRSNQDFERAKAEFKDGRTRAGSDTQRFDDKAVVKFDTLRRGRREQWKENGVALIEEPDKRVIVRERDRAFIRHDETARFRRAGREERRERRADGVIVSILAGLAGAAIISELDDDGHLLRRLRRDAAGREYVLIDNRDFYRRHRGHRDYFNAYVDLPPPTVRIPRERYIVDYDSASYDDVYEALSAPPVERLERGYSLEEVRQSYELRERMRRIDLDTINFAFAAWDVDEDQYPKLERIAEAMKRIIDRNPDEMFFLEGHTDAVGSDIDNLSLSDRRAETVAIILSDTFRVPAENLTTQGYGEQFLKVETEGPSRANRRVSVRRITPLLSRRQRGDDE